MTAPFGSDPRPPWLAQASRWLLALAIMGAALAVGTVHTVTLCIVTGVLAAAAVLGWWGAEPMRARASATVLLFTGIGLTAYTALQCVPMPIAWLEVIAPHNADVWSRALAPLHEAGPAWAPISLDPIATRVEVLKGVAYLLAFVTALRVARRKEGVAFLGAVIVATGILLGLAAVLHPAFGARRLFGLYEPGPGITERHIAPLMNPNNLAGYLTLALCLSLGMLLAPEPRIPRPIAGAIVLLLGATQVWVASRGGVITTVLGALIVVAIARLERSRERSERSVGTIALVSGLGMVAGAVLIVLGGSDEASTELLDSDVSKLKMFVATVQSVPVMPFFGCGRGAFESVYPAFRTGTGYLTYSHPENVVAQWIVEWGLPVGIAGLAAVAVALRPSVVLARALTASGAWAGVVALAVQNLGDLGTEIPGLMTAIVVCGAIVTAGTPGRDAQSRIERWSRAPRRVAAVAAAGAATALLAALTALGRELRDDQKALLDAALARHTSAAEMHAMARATMLRHPSEPYLPFITSLRASREHDDNPLPWVGATFERAKVYAPAHLVLARVLASRSPSQARLEYRLTMEQAPGFVDDVMAEAPRMVGSYFDAVELVPTGSAGTPVLAKLIESLQPRLPATCVRLDAELASRAPTELGPVLRGAIDAVKDVETGASWCDGPARQSCVDRALDLVGRAQRLAPGYCAAYSLTARIQIANGNAAGGLKDLSDAADAVVDRVECLRGLVILAASVGDDAHETDGIGRIASAGCRADAECARNLAWIGSIERGRGNAQRALALYKRAYERLPEDDTLLEVVAGLAADSGLHAEAADDYDRLARRQPTQPKWKDAATRERAAAVRSAVSL